MWFILALLSAFFAALVAIFGKIGIKGVDSTLAATIKAFFMFVLLGVLSFTTGRLSELAHIQPKALKFIILASIAGAISWICYFAALKTGLASKVATIDRLSLIFVIILAALFLGETITARSILGIILLTAGAVLLTI